MKIIVHTASSTNLTQKLLDTVPSIVSKEAVYFTHEIDALAEALLKYRIENPIVVITCSSMAESTVMMTLQDLFAGLFMIIVTDSENPELLRSCRKLYPRLLVSNEQDYELIDVVIRKYQEMQ